MIRHIKKLARWLWRSAITGKFVSKDYADAHKDTTVREKR